MPSSIHGRDNRLQNRLRASCAPLGNARRITALAIRNATLRAKLSVYSHHRPAAQATAKAMRMKLLAERGRVRSGEVASAG